MGRCTLFRLEPEGRIGFPRGAEESTSKILKLENTSEDAITWKVRTTGAKTFLVKPRAGVLKKGESAETTLTFLPNAGETDLRLQVQATALKDGQEAFAREDWRAVPRSAVEASELSVYLLGQPARQQELGSGAQDEGFVPVFSQPTGGYERSMPLAGATRSENESRARHADDVGLPAGDEGSHAPSPKAPVSGVNTAAFDARFGGSRLQDATPSATAMRQDSPVDSRQESQGGREESKEGVWHRPAGVQRTFGNSAASRAGGAYGENARSDNRTDFRGSQFVNATHRQRAPASRASEEAVTGVASRAKAGATAKKGADDSMNPIVKVLLFVLVAVLTMNLYFRPLAELLTGVASSVSAEAKVESNAGAADGGAA